jgi:Ca2+-dependent lipid-binding protein
VVIWTTSTKDNKVRTKTIKNGGSEAIWEETFDIIVNDHQAESVYFEVKNRNYFNSDALIGKVKFACADVDYDRHECWIKIFSDYGADAGEILIAACRILEN